MVNKTKYYLIGAAAVALYFMTTKTKVFSAPTAGNVLRGCDPLGCGNFGAPRGNRKHAGIDYVAAPGENIYAPITGKVTRHPKPYSDDNSYFGIEIVNADYKVKMFYVNPTAQIGSNVVAGQRIGVAQNISAKHGAAMTNHVHFEVYNSVGELIDPSDMFQGVRLNYNQVLMKGMYNLPEVKKLQQFLNITADGDFGVLTEAALLARKGVKKIALKDF